MKFAWKKEHKTYVTRKKYFKNVMCKAILSQFVFSRHLLNLKLSVTGVDECDKIMNIIHGSWAFLPTLILFVLVLCL